MTKSAANFAASCFAALACLICFSAAPVAGQDTGQLRPAASPPVLSPTPVPTALPTPRPVLPVVSTAPATTSPATAAAPTSPVGPLGPIIAGIIGGVLGGVISPYLTYKLGERNRKLDLYKIYYAAKLKAITEVSDTLSSSCGILFRHLQDKSVSVDDFAQMLVELNTKIKTCACFLDKEATDCMNACAKIIIESAQTDDFDTDLYYKALDRLNTTFRATMHKEVFDELFPKG